jgi:subfamily B ATP-binding cassette protein MsbA
VALFGQKIPPPRARAEWPLRPILSRQLPMVPLIAALGFLATALEGIGIGLLIPLLALLLANGLPPDLPKPIEWTARLVLGFDAQTRILMLAGAVFSLIALKGVVQAANGWLLALVEGRIGRDIRDALADRLLALDFPFFLKNDRSRLSRILAMDSDQVIHAIRSGLALIPATVGLAVLGALLAWLNLKLFLIAVVGAAVVQVVLFYFERRQGGLSRDVIRTEQDLWDRMLSLVNGVRVIRIFGQRQVEDARFARDSERVRRAFQSSRTLFAIITPTIDAMVALLFVVILLAGYWIGMTIPAITAFLVLLSRAQPHAYVISHSRLGIASIRGALNEVEWLLSQTPTDRRKPTLSTPFELDRPIVFDRVTYAYPDGSEALTDAQFSLRPGVVTALIGRSGAGKTSIVNLLCRLVEPTSGRIRLGELPAETIDPDKWRAHIAVAGQDMELVDATVAENIAYGRPDASRSEIEQVAAAAGASDFIARLPQGFDTRVAGHGHNLSGGQRQRIGLARALLCNADLLILDEATNAVDAVSEQEIMKLLDERLYFRTALVISHRKSTLAACDDGIVIEDGRITEAGPLRSLSYYRRMAGDTGAVA